MAIILPEPVRQRAIRAGAEAWVEGLPDMVAEFEREWRISTGAVLSGAADMHGLRGRYPMPRTRRQPCR